MRKSACIVFLAGLLTLASVPASAALILLPGNVPQTDENVLMTNGLVGNPLFGETNVSNLPVKFESSTDILAMFGGGQARIEALDLSLNNVMVSIPGGTFTSIIFDVGDAVDAMLTVNLLGGAIGVFGLGPFGPGNNFFTLVASGGDVIENIVLDSVGGIQHLKQVRLGGGALVPVSEPASLLLFGTGLLGIRFARRIRRR